MKPELSIIIPAYNEEKRILPTLEEYFNFYTNLKLDFEIIVVCNGCNDRTFEVVSKFSLEKDNIWALDLPEKLGKGFAIKQGLKVAQGNIQMFVDADNSTGAKESLKLMEVLKR